MKRIICKKNLRTSVIIILSNFLYCQNSFSFSVVRSSARFTPATSKELSFFQKKYFKIMQFLIKRDLKQNPDLSINKYYDPKKRNSNPMLYGLPWLRL